MKVCLKLLKCLVDLLWYGGLGNDMDVIMGECSGPVSTELLV